MNKSVFIETLQCTKKSKEIGEKLLDDLKRGRFRRLAPADAYLTHIPVILIVTKGNGNRMRLQDVLEMYIDTDNITEKAGIGYIYRSYSERGFVKKFRTQKDRILIDLERNKNEFNQNLSL